MQGGIMKKAFVGILLPLVVAFTASPVTLAQKKGKRAKIETKSTHAETEARNVEYLTKAIRKELVTLPFFGVFDWLEGNVTPDGTVVLRGEVTRPTTKSDAERRVEKIEGVEKVVN